MQAVPPRARLPESATSSFLPVSSVILLSLLVKPQGDAGRGKHQHRVERVHDLLQSLHWNSPLSELRKMPPIPPLVVRRHPGLCGTFVFPCSKRSWSRAPIHIVQFALYI